MRETRAKVLPTRRACPAARWRAAMFGTGASGRGAPARDRWGQRERRERDRSALAVRSRRDAHPPAPPLELEGGRAPRRGVSSPPASRREPPGGVGRSWPGAFGRSKNKSRARPAHRARDAARAARGRRAARKICVFEAPAPRSGGRAVRRGARARRARVGSGAGPPGGARGAAPASGRARAGRWRRPARRGAAAGRRHFRCSLCFI